MSEANIRHSLGQAGMRYKGAYNAATEYKFMNAVMHTSALYILVSKTPQTGVEPGTNPLIWEQMMVSATTVEMLAAQAAQTAAETARDQAVTAKGAAETAQGAAETAQGAAETSASNAANSATLAGQHKDAAAASESNAAASATAAQTAAASVLTIDQAYPNLLHNWDFRNPINQRAVTGTISSAGYFFDRWILNSGSVTVAAGYMTMASGAVIEQRIEGLYLAGETVTVSVKVGSNIHSGTGAFPTAAGTVGITLTGFGTATLGYNVGYMFVRFAASGGQNVEVVKLELGTGSTLHLDPPMDYAVELPKCQRFYAPAEGILQYYAHVSNTAYFYGCVPFPVTMRINPTMVFGACTIHSIQANIQGLITSVRVSNNREITEVCVNKSFTGSSSTSLTLNVHASADL